MDDKQPLNYNGSIYDFMEIDGPGTYVILVLGETYLKSQSCMQELNEIIGGADEYPNRFFFLIAENTLLLNPDERKKSMASWENEISRRKEPLKENGESPEDNKWLYKRNKRSNFRNNLNNLIFPVLIEPCNFKRNEKLARLQFFRCHGASGGSPNIPALNYADW